MKYMNNVSMMCLKMNGDESPAFDTNYCPSQQRRYS